MRYAIALGGLIAFASAWGLLLAWMLPGAPNAGTRAVITFIPTLVVGGWVGWWLAKPRTDATKRRAGR